MRDIDYMIQTMQAYRDGKEIEFSLVGDTVWSCASKPIWNWHKFDYRVKPEPPQKKVVPYESAEELFEAQKKHGMYLRFKPNFPVQIYAIPSYISDGKILIGGSEKTFEELLDKMLFADGHPCGKEVEI